MTENTDENEYFRKRSQKWSLLKTRRCEDAPILVWIGENGAFWKWRKKSKSTVVFIGVLGRFNVDERRKRINRHAFWTGENKTSVWGKMFCFVFVRIQKDTFKSGVIQGSCIGFHYTRACLPLVLDKQRMAFKLRTLKVRLLTEINLSYRISNWRKSQFKITCSLKANSARWQLLAPGSACLFYKLRVRNVGVNSKYGS